MRSISVKTVIILLKETLKILLKILLLSLSFLIASTISEPFSHSDIKAGIRLGGCCRSASMKIAASASQKVKAAAICHTDITILEGEHNMIQYPRIPGHEFSGLVEKVGNAVRHVKPGDRVTALAYSYCGICRACRRGMQTGCTDMIAMSFHYDGAFAQYVSVPAISVYPISDDLSFEDGAMVEAKRFGST